MSPNSRDTNENTKSVTEPDNQSKPEAPQARFVNIDQRSKSVPLDHPLEFDGKIYNRVTIRRVTGTEVADYVNALMFGEKQPYPGIEVPEPVYRNLDADDLAKVDRELKDFLPLSFQEGNMPIQEASENIPA